VTTVCRICAGTGRTAGLSCRTCQGTGTTEVGGGGGNCFLCDGTGLYVRYRVDASGAKHAYREEVCRTCDGTGNRAPSTWDERIAT
jgi:DnaJ-class molecular chaperone